MSGTPHLSAETLDALLDGELDARERIDAEAHVASCEVCVRALEQAIELGVRLGTLAQADAPEDARFEARLRAALDREDALSMRQRVPRKLVGKRWQAAALAAAAALAIVWLALARTPELPAEAALRVAAVAREAQQTLDASTIEARFAAAGLEFPARLLDLGMMGWRVSGGGVAKLARHPVAEVVYRDDAGRALLCAMLVAAPGSLPADGARFTENGIAFFVFTRGDVTVVAWAEGDVLCLLAGALPAAELRALAVAKAMLPVRS